MEGLKGVGGLPEQNRTHGLSSGSPTKGKIAGMVIGVVTAAAGVVALAASVGLSITTGILAASAPLIFAVIALKSCIGGKSLLAWIGSLGRSAPQLTETGPLVLPNGLVIGNPEEASRLRKFRPSAQMAIVRDGLLNPATRDLDWTVTQLQNYNSEEIQLLLDNFGEKFRSLDFREDDGKHHLENINVGRCSNLQHLVLAGGTDLQTVAGLARCEKLAYLDLSDCPRLAENLPTELAKIPNSGIQLDLSRSNLQLTTVSELEEKFGDGGVWNGFLQNHPSCTILNPLRGKEMAAMATRFAELASGNKFEAIPGRGYSAIRPKRSNS